MCCFTKPRTCKKAGSNWNLSCVHAGKKGKRAKFKQHQSSDRTELSVRLHPVCTQVTTQTMSTYRQNRQSSWQVTDRQVAKQITNWLLMYAQMHTHPHSRMHMYAHENIQTHAHTHTHTLTPHSWMHACLNGWGHTHQEKEFTHLSCRHVTSCVTTWTVLMGWVSLLGSP